MPAGQIIGRISIKVLPDTDSFRKEVKAQLAVIEKGLEFVIPTKLDITGAKRDLITTVRAINAENKSMDSRKIQFATQISTANMRSELATYRREATAMAKANPLKMKVELGAVAAAKLELDKSSLDYVKQQIEHWRRGVDPVKVTVKAEYSTTAGLATSAKLMWLSRDRFVTLIPKVSSAAAAEVGTILASLSGARMLQSTWNNLWDMFKNLDKIIPLIAAIGLGIGALGASALSSASNIFALAASIGSIAAIGLILPGILAGVVMGLGITLLAFKGIQKFMPKLYKQWTDFKELATKDFWSTASAGVQKLATVYLPQLATTAKVLGTFWGGLASALSKPFHSALSTMFDNLNKSIKISTAGTGVFADVITKLGLAGSAYLPRLATWVVKISTTFDKWLGKISADGTMKKWVDQGIIALHDLGRVLTSSIDVLADLGRAAQAAGGSTLGMLADSLAHLHAVTSGPAFQKGMADAFRAAHQAILLITEKSGPAVSNFFKTFSQTLVTLLPTIGSTLGVALKAVADALAMPAVQKGLSAMFAGFQKGIDALAPAMKPLGAALGSLMKLIGTMSQYFGPLLSTTLKTLADAFVKLEPTISALIPVLTGSLLTAIIALSPAIVAVAIAIAPLITALGQGLAQAINVVSPILVKFATPLAVLTVGLLSAYYAMKVWAAGVAVVGLVTSVVSAAKTVASITETIAIMALYAAAWVSTAATATVSAIKIAADWVIALGPIAWVTAAIAALVAGIVWVATQTTWFQTIWEYAWHGVEKVVGGIVSNIVIGFKALFDGIMWAVGGIVHAASLIPGPWQSGMQSADRAVQGFIGNADRNMQGIINSARTWGDQTGTNYAGGLAATKPIVDAAAAALADAVTVHLIPLGPTAGTTGVTTATQLAGGLSANLPSVSASAFAAANAVNFPLGQLPGSAGGAGAKTALGLGAGITNNVAVPNAAAVAVAATVQARLYDIGAAAAGTQADAALAAGLTGKASLTAVNAAGASVADTVKYALNNVNAVQIGYNIAVGLAKGIDSGKPDANKAALGTAQAVKNAVEYAWLVQSPSKVAMGYGENFGAGLAIGIDSSSTPVGQSATDLADGVTDRLSTGLGNAKTAAMGVLNSLVTWIGGVPGRTVSALTPLNTVSNWFSTWFTNAKTTGMGVLNSTVAWIGGIPGRTVSALTPLNTVSNWFSTWFGNAKNAGMGVLNSTVAWIAGVPGRAVSALSPLNTVASWFSTWFTAGKNAAMGVLNSLVGWVGGIPGRIVGALGSTLTMLTEKGRNIITGLWNGLKAVWGDSKGGVVGWLSGLAAWIKKIKGPLSFDAQLLVPAGKAIMQGFWDGLKTTYGYVTTWISSVAVGIAGGVAKWLPIVEQALSIMGQSLTLAPIVLRRMNQESGGNPFAINLTDSNAKAGHPSQGLMQCIPGTFNAYRLPGLSANILDPLSNIVASMRYAMAEYGSLATAYNRAGGYAFGTKAAAPGWHWIGEKGPELMKFRGGETVIPQSALSGANAGDGFGAGTTINIPMMPTNSTPEDVADALLFAVRRMANGGVYV